MKIMVLGNNYNVSTLIKKLVSEDSVSCVYTSMYSRIKSEKLKRIEADKNDINALISYAKDNEITYSIILDDNLLKQDASRKFAMAELLVFSPDSDSYKVCKSKTIVKKLAYKLKIPTPKFGLYDKENHAISAIREFKFPIVVKSDEGDFYEICETYKSAKDVIQNLFFHDYKKVVLEQYIEGEYFSFYVVCDGYDVIPFGAVYSYVNPKNFDDVVNIFPYNSVDNEIEAKIAREFIFPIIDEFNANENVFLGILGLDLILTPDKKLYLIGLNNFFKKYDAQSVINAVDMNLSELFYAAAEFKLREKFENIIFKNCYFSSFAINKEKIELLEDTLLEKYDNINIASVFSTTVNGLTDRITELYEAEIG